MKDKIQIALLALNSVLLLALVADKFAGGFGGSSDQMASGNVVAAIANNPSSIPPPPPKSNVFDPTAASTAEVVDNTPKTAITFKKFEHDFGTIKQDSENKHVFTFTNTGTEPLIIESATGSCGCTVPNYPKHPIPPGGTGDIEVEYKPGKQENAQTKTVTLVANTEPKQTELRIKAFVTPGPGGSTTTGHEGHNH